MVTGTAPIEVDVVESLELFSAVWVDASVVGCSVVRGASVGVVLWVAGACDGVALGVVVSTRCSEVVEVGVVGGGVREVVVLSGCSVPVSEGVVLVGAGVVVDEGVAEVLVGAPLVGVWPPVEVGLLGAGVVECCGGVDGAVVVALGDPVSVEVGSRVEVGSAGSLEVVSSGDGDGVVVVVGSVVGAGSGSATAAGATARERQVIRPAVVAARGARTRCVRRRMRSPLVALRGLPRGNDVGRWLGHERLGALRNGFVSRRQYLAFS
ncbi:hypothetical protein ACT3TZ_12700 [Brachybacterium sp. AOP25-B2-12]